MKNKAGLNPVATGDLKLECLLFTTNSLPSHGDLFEAVSFSLFRKREDGIISILMYAVFFFSASRR